MKDANRKAMHAKTVQYKVFKKNIYTKNKWVQSGENHATLPSAGAKADYIKSSKFIVSKGKKSPKTQTKIVKVYV